MVSQYACWLSNTAGKEEGCIPCEATATWNVKFHQHTIHPKYEATNLRKAKNHAKKLLLSQVLINDQKPWKSSSGRTTGTK